MSKEQNLTAEIELLRNAISDSAAVIEREERTRLFLLLQKEISPGAGQITERIHLLRESEDERDRMELLRQVLFLGICIKRRCNLILMEQAAELIDGEELQTSFREIVRGLEHAGIYASGTVDITGEIPPQFALFCIELCEGVIREGFSAITAVMITVKKTADAFRFLMQADYKSLPDLSFLEPFREAAALKSDLFGRMELDYSAEDVTCSITLRYRYV